MRVTSALFVMLLGACRPAITGLHPPEDVLAGLVVAPENRCAPYDRGTYEPFRSGIEEEIVESMGGRIYGPYTGRYFTSIRETDREHIVAVSEAHDSGACGWGRDRRNHFFNDLENLTLAAPDVNRHQKGSKDVAEWMPEFNRCWFAARVVTIKRAWGLTVDRAEADTLATVVAGCDSTDMVFTSD